MSWVGSSAMYIIDARAVHVCTAQVPVLYSVLTPAPMHRRRRDSSTSQLLGVTVIRRSHPLTSTSPLSRQGPKVFRPAVDWIWKFEVVQMEWRNIHPVRTVPFLTNLQLGLVKRL